MRKWKKAAVAAMVCLTGVLFMPSMKAEAKNPSMVELKAGKTYKSYDITGDKKKDTVKISIPKDQYDRYGTVKITVNKKTTKITRTWTSYAIHTRLITLKNGKAYLWVQGETDNEDDPWECIYQYKKGRFKKVVDFSKTSYNYTNHHHTDILKVSGNTISTKQYIMSTAMAGVEYKVNYTYKKGALKKTSSAYEITSAGYTYRANGKYGTMKNTKALYNSVSCKKKVATVKAGTKAKAVKIYMTGKVFNIKIKTASGKTGWVKGARKFSDKSLLFKECFYAG